MSVKLKRQNLQRDNSGEYKYDYIWTRDQGDGEYTGIKDRVRIDKDEGYEVMYFIEYFMNKEELDKLKDAHKIEDALHDPSLSSVVMRGSLIKEIEKKLGISH